LLIKGPDKQMKEKFLIELLIMSFLVFNLSGWAKASIVTITASGNVDHAAGYRNSTLTGYDAQITELMGLKMTAIAVYSTDGIEETPLRDVINYENALKFFSVTLDSQTLTDLSIENTDSMIQIANNYLYFNDNFAIVSHSFPSSNKLMLFPDQMPWDEVASTLVLRDLDGLAWSNAVLPSEFNFDISILEYKNIRTTFSPLQGNFNTIVEATITSFEVEISQNSVPVPSAIWLFGFGFACILFIRQRK